MAKNDEETEVLDIPDSCEAMEIDEVADSEEAVVLDTDDDDDVASFRSPSVSGSTCKKWRSGYIRRGVFAVGAPTPSPEGFAAVKRSDKLRSSVSDSIHLAGDDFSSEREIEAGLNQDGLQCNGNMNILENKTKKKQFLGKHISGYLNDEKHLSENKSEVSFNEKSSMLRIYVEQETTKLRGNESQESEDLSQANALGFVDRYLSLNNMHVLEKDTPGKTCRPKSPPVSCAKGSQELARRAIFGTSCGLSRTFEWDDHVDKIEENVLQNKDLNAKLDGSKPRSTKYHGNQKLPRDKICTECPVPVVENYKAIDEVENSIINCVKELDVELNEESSLHIEARNIGGNVPDAYDVGFDTQMAAEAMEALFYAPPRSFNFHHAHHQDPGNIIENSSVGEQTNPNSGIPIRKFKGKNGSTKKDYERRSKFSEMNKKMLDPELLESKSGGSKNLRKSLTKTDSNSVCPTNVSVHSCDISVNLTQQGKKAKALRRDNINNGDEDLIATTPGEHNPRGQGLLRRKKLNSSSIANRTRHSSSVHKKEETKNQLDSSAEGINGDMEPGTLKKRMNYDHAEMLPLSTVRRKRSKTCFLKSEVAGNVKTSQNQQQIVNFGPVGCQSHSDIWSFPKGKRKHRKVRHQLNGLGFFHKQTFVKEGTGLSPSTGCPKGSENSRSSSCLKVYVRRKSRTVVHDHRIQSSVVLNFEDSLRQNSEVQSSKNVFDPCSFATNGEMTVPSEDTFEASRLCGSMDSLAPTSTTGSNKLLEKPHDKAGTGLSSLTGCPKRSEENSRSSVLKVYVRRKSRPIILDHRIQSPVVKNFEDSLKQNSEVQRSKNVFGPCSSAANAEMTVPTEDTFGVAGLCGSVDSLDPTSPATSATQLLEKPQNANTSPSGSGNLHQLCNRRCSRVPLMKELLNLGISDLSPTYESKQSRTRRDLKNVRVLFSLNMDDTLIKKQKKILRRLGGSIASSCSEATHFVADRFVRTRNMLETIALGKPVVTHLWLASCGQAKFLVDEKNYILRDAKKEKEIGFSLPVSLANARKAPLLEGRRVFVTPNIKPERELIVSLVKALQGEVWSDAEDTFIEAVKKEMIPDDIIILSSEQDHDFCAPLLDQGVAIYSSELLMNGIVIQKLEFGRHRLFRNHF